MKSGALFAGYGGLDLAVEEVFGATPAWVSEIEPGPSQILARRFGNIPNLGDITKVDWSAVEPVDIITGMTTTRALGNPTRMW
jgi:DNA (cytosine-5)-methyltransferase 1